MGKRWGSRVSATLSLLAIVGLTACLEGPEVSTGDGPASNVRVVEQPDEAATSAPSTTQAPTTQPPTTEATTTAPTTTTTEAPSTTTEITVPATTTEPTTTTAAPEPPPPDFAAQSVAYVNQRRAEDGIHGLEVDPELTALADGWARQMAADQQLRHNPDLFDNRPERYWTIGENVAYSSDPTTIDDGWWNSHGHQQNIMNASYAHIGVAFVQDDGGTWWAVQVFAG